MSLQHGPPQGAVALLVSPARLRAHDGLDAARTLRCRKALTVVAQVLGLTGATVQLCPLFRAVDRPEKMNGPDEVRKSAAVDCQVVLGATVGDDRDRTLRLAGG